MSTRYLLKIKNHPKQVRTVFFKTSILVGLISFTTMILVVLKNIIDIMTKFEKTERIVSNLMIVAYFFYFLLQT